MSRENYVLPNEVIYFKAFIDVLGNLPRDVKKSDFVAMHAEDEEIWQFIRFINDESLSKKITLSRLDEELFVMPLDIIFNNFSDLVNFVKVSKPTDDRVIKTIQRESNYFIGDYRDFFRSLITGNIKIY